MTAKYYNKQPLNLKRFFISRFARIYPVYFLALLFWVLTHIFKGLNFHELIKIVLTLFLIQSWYPPYHLTYNYPTWFLSVLMFFYIIFPFILSYITNKKGSQIFLLALAVWICSAVLFYVFHNRPAILTTHYELSNFTLFNPIIMYLNSFIVGIAGGVFIVSNKNRYPDFIPVIMIIFSLVITWFIISLGTSNHWRSSILFQRNTISSFAYVNHGAFIG